MGISSVDSDDRRDVGRFYDDDNHEPLGRGAGAPPGAEARLDARHSGAVVARGGTADVFEGAKRPADSIGHLQFQYNPGLRNNKTCIC